MTSPFSALQPKAERSAGATPSCTGALSRATCAQPAQRLSARQHRPAHNPTALSPPRAPAGPSSPAPEPHSQGGRPGLRDSASLGEPLLPPWGQAPTPAPRCPLHRGREYPSPTGPGWLGWHHAGPLAAPDRPTDSSEPSEDLGSPLSAAGPGRCWGRPRRPTSGRPR